MSGMLFYIDRHLNVHLERGCRVMSKNRYFIGERVVYYYHGEKFVFIYRGNGDFEQIEGGLVPSSIREELLGGE